MLIVVDLMEPQLTKQEMGSQLRLMAVKRNVTQILSVATFHTALDGTIVICALSAISLTAETQGTTHLGRRSEKVCSFHHVCYRIGILTIKSVEMCRCNFVS